MAPLVASSSQLLSTTPHARLMQPPAAGVVSIAAAAEHSLALTSSGEVYSWGHASHGALGLGRARHGHREFTPRMVSALHGVKVASISAGYYGSAAIDTGGRAFVWGAGTFGQLGLGGMEHVHVPKALPLPGGGEVRQVVQGFQHGLALTRGGQVFVWGNDTNGCLGQGDGVWVRAPILTPKHLPLGREARFVACGYNHSMAVAEDGSAWAWGNSGAASAGIWDLNADYGGGQLGLGDDTHRGSPHRIVRVMPNRYKHIDVRAADRSQHWKALGVSAGHNHSAMIAEADVSTADLAPPPGAAAAAGTAAARSTS